MKTRPTVLVVLAAAAALASVAAAGPAATKQRAAITMKFHDRAFVLAPLEAGPLERDSGTFLELATGAKCTDVVREGQKVGLCFGSWMLTGELGTLTIRGSQSWVDPGSPGCGVAFGAWKVVRGTGAYAAVTGGGRSAYDAHCSKWYARHEGFLRSK